MCLILYTIPLFFNALSTHYISDKAQSFSNLPNSDDILMK